MPTIVVSTNIAGDVKPSFASSAIVGLTVRANGEEALQVLDAGGGSIDSYFPAYNDNAHSPLPVSDGTPGKLPPNKFAAYLYVYAATTKYPFVENDVAIGGSVAPRGNPNRQAAGQVSATGQSMTVRLKQNNRIDIDEIWIFRTTWYDSANEASVNAIAGNAFYIGSMPNDPDAGEAYIFYDDQSETDGTDKVETDNQQNSNFRFVIYSDPYWWGWGNDTFKAQANWTTGGVVTLLGGRKWFAGRNGQYVKLAGITTGGFDGQGTFLFSYLSATTAQLLDDEFATIGVATAGVNKAVVIQGPSTTLFRSKPRNPFSWGKTEIFGSISIPQPFALRVGGGQGTAIAALPNSPYLLLSTEFPAGSFVLDLRLAAADNFGASLRKISDFYSITSHFSQFAATRQDRSIALWGWDAKNYAILECDGVSIRPVSDSVSKTLRNMTSNRSRQRLAHGAYDARNSLNCLWVPTANSITLVNLLIAQHAPSQQWFLQDEHDVLCSAQFQDGDTNLNKIFVGTQSGFVGEAFAEGKFVDWLDNNSPAAGNIVFGNVNGFQILTDILFEEDELAYIGSWALITDSYGEHEQWARILNCNVASQTLSFDMVYSELGGSGIVFNPIPSFGWKIYIGLIEIRARKYFDLNSPSTDKKLSEVWLTLDQVDTALKLGGDGSTFLRYYRDRSLTPYSPLSTGKLNIPLKLVSHDGTGPSQAWFTQDPPTDRIKTFGIEIIDRSYKAWKMYNWTLKGS